MPQRKDVGEKESKTAGSPPAQHDVFDANGSITNITAIITTTITSDRR
jgi:hypothetical protein